MTKEEISHFQEKLQSERANLEQQLSKIGKKDKSSVGGWDATSGNMEVDTADENELADKLEELEDNNGIVTQLEKQLNDVKDALEKIENGNYGTCETCGKPIEKERLEANPSAKISLKHGH